MEWWWWWQRGWWKWWRGWRQQPRRHLWLGHLRLPRSVPCLRRPRGRVPHRPQGHLVGPALRHCAAGGPAQARGAWVPGGRPVHLDRRAPAPGRQLPPGDPRVVEGAEWRGAALFCACERMHTCARVRCCLCSVCARTRACACVCTHACAWTVQVLPVRTATVALFFIAPHSCLKYTACDTQWSPAAVRGLRATPIPGSPCVTPGQVFHVVSTARAVVDPSTTTPLNPNIGATQVLVKTLSGKTTTVQVRIHQVASYMPTPPSPPPPRVCDACMMLCEPMAVCIGCGPHTRCAPPRRRACVRA